ncbi:MAG: alcohol dehydrogenase [Myxococcales bacterium]|nr:alcohol dehydrogenase [Myxococcales bacterium]
MVMEGHGGPEVLVRRTLEICEPGPREVRVRVRAVALNHLDLWVRRGGPAFKLELPHRLGSDIAGEIECVGPGARGVSVGDRVLVHPGRSCGVCGACKAGRDNLCRHYRVLGENAQGGYTQFIVVGDDAIVPLGALSWTEGAAIPLCAVTAWQMAFRKGEVAPGLNVLVNAAGSGVSTMLIQLCKVAGARVIATTSSAAKVEHARLLGADEVIVTSEEDLAAGVRRLTDKLGVDVAFDHLGGEPFEKTLSALRWGGRLVTCGATAGFAAKLDLRTIFFKQLEIRGSTMGTKADLVSAMSLVASGKLRPVVDRVMPLWDVAEAHRVLERREAFGKVVLEVS